MATQVLATVIAEAGTGAGNNRAVVIDRAVSECPICHYTIQPEYLIGAPIAAYRKWLEIYYRCTNPNCRRHFTGFYKHANAPHADFPQVPFYALSTALPAEPKPFEADEVIKTLSPDFVRIYSQAEAAESQGLDEIAGPGFRKSLEFLVKDYAISLYSADSDKIKAAPLAAVIKDYLPGDKLTVVSSRAAWLGNDETHYERRWVGKNLDDLKRLIGATIHFIAMDKLAAELPTDMPAPAKATK